MEKAKVYFTDFHTVAFGDGLPAKLKKLIKKAGVQDLDIEEKFVAIKMHFGEMGNISYLRPNYAKAVADVVREFGGKPFLTDCNTLYPGSRKNALEHLYCAWENGFTPMTVGCPIMIGDGLKGTDDVDVPVRGGEYIKEAKIGRAIMDADIFIKPAEDAAAARRSALTMDWCSIRLRIRCMWLQSIALDVGDVSERVILMQSSLQIVRR